MKMEGELKDLKMVLRSLVVSSPTEVDVRTLLRDYRNMMGAPVPFAKFGYRDPLAFIREKCGDCFLVSQGSNPVLTLIVPDAVKHIDKFVQKQKSTSTTRFKGKRRSVPEGALRKNYQVVNTFEEKKTDYTIVKVNEELEHSSHRNNHMSRDNSSNNLTNGVCERNKGRSEQTNTQCSSDALQNFMKKRIPVLDSCKLVDSDMCIDGYSFRGDTDSGRQSASSNSSSKKAQLEELKMEIRELIDEVPAGVWCTELMRLYREKYGRELNFARFGFTSVLSLAYAVEELQYCVAEHAGELLLMRAGDPRPVHPIRAALPAHAVPRREHSASTGDPEDALPGIDFDADVFPRDCMHLMQSIAPQSLDEVGTGAMLEVVLGEVYSPTHFWLLRLGPAHYSAMEDIMDEMNVYYREEGAERVLAGGAVRVGHYCACCYLGDWHRAVVVKVLDSDTVKVRHIDYATVESVATRDLKPLLRRWAGLPAQAVRARLAGVRPPAAGRRWPWAAAAHFLDLVKERRLVANVVAKDAQESILEVLLIDTSTDEDICISTEMCRSGHADARPDSALGVSVCYDSSSPDSEDVRSLLSTLADIRQDDVNDNGQEEGEGDGDADSDISASASEVVGRGPRLIRTWECDDPVDRATDVSTTSGATCATVRSQYLRLRLAALRAGRHQNSDTTASSTQDDRTLDGSESVLSAVQVRLQLFQRLKKVAIQHTDQPESTVNTQTNDCASSSTETSSDSAESTCSTIEARMRQYRELKEKRAAAAAVTAGGSDTDSKCSTALSAVETSECYLYPRFDALETGDTPNYGEIYCYLRDGISLEFVEDYRRHVPPCLPRPEPCAAPSSSPTPSPPPPPAPAKAAAVPGARAVSLSPSFETQAAQKSFEVDNCGPLLQPEPISGPPPRSARSLPTERFPAPPCPPGALGPPPHHPHSAMHLSPFAPPFFPQSFSSPPMHGFPRHPPVFFPHRPPYYFGPPDPPPSAPPGGISVPASECEIFALLSRVDPAAAHRYMVDALSRAVAATHVTCAMPSPVPCPRPAPPPFQLPPGFEHASSLRPAR